ncbi:hypothetical protein QM588_10005 [Rhodococcus sp. IEGM 1354]|uniref:hypothetical protein n=1 Tax=Rhodococcus sp. IEGM 1354 TaxID=3047088 RepID=UPI0024B7112B|nr:hypothetical protein [Rhodococcus sp. IEGM 1354]MDI9930731.1 hypothetical protein [Rhodococcus sp. IEGM 1354]
MRGVAAVSGTVFGASETDDVADQKAAQPESRLNVDVDQLTTTRLGIVVCVSVGFFGTDGYSENPGPELRPGIS